MHFELSCSVRNIFFSRIVAICRRQSQFTIFYGSETASSSRPHSVMSSEWDFSSELFAPSLSFVFAVSPLSPSSSSSYYYSPDLVIPNLKKGLLVFWILGVFQNKIFFITTLLGVIKRLNAVCLPPLAAIILVSLRTESRRASLCRIIPHSQAVALLGDFTDELIKQHWLLSSHSCLCCIHVFT